MSVFNAIENDIKNYIQNQFPYGELESSVISTPIKARYICEETDLALTDAIQHNFYINIPTGDEDGIFFNLIILEMGETYVAEKTELTLYNEDGSTPISNDWPIQIKQIIEQYLKPHKSRFAFR